MEPSQDLASTGKFSDTESGWTSYIGSPIYNEVSNDDDEHSVDIKDYGNNYKNARGNPCYDIYNKGENNDDSDRDTDEESDDSMASDAASGPSHLQFVCINSEGSHGLDFTEHTENDTEKIPLAKRTTKHVRKTRYKGIVEKEEGSLLVADSAASHVLRKSQVQSS